jgi:hypothetical protein
MRGRIPSGPDYVQGLAGSTPAKERLQVILQTMTGTCRVSEACDLLGIGMQRFHQLRRRALLGALAALEPRASGRPGRRSLPSCAARSRTCRSNCGPRNCARRSP